MIPVMLNFETSNGIKLPKLNFDFKQRKLFYLIPTGKNSFKTFRTVLSFLYLVDSDLIGR